MKPESGGRVVNMGCCFGCFNILWHICLKLYENGFVFRSFLDGAITISVKTEKFQETRSLLIYSSAKFWNKFGTVQHADLTNVTTRIAIYRLNFRSIVLD